VIPLKDNIPTDRLPVVTIGLIIVNVIVYLLAIRHGGSLWSGPAQGTSIKYGAIPFELTHPGKHCVDLGNEIGCGTGAGSQPGTAFTVLSSMFMHGGFIHIAGNMLFLWIFGNNVEDSMGRVTFLAFYLIGGVAALALQTVVDPNAAVPTIGASGAIAAVLGGYLVLYPRARVVALVFIILFFTVIEIPAMIVLGFWFLLQLYNAAQDLSDPVGGGGGVAVFAHVGGFVFGLLVIRLLAHKAKTVPPRYPVY
jgi:membrane associated rhomboid family serine protease